VNSPASPASIHPDVAFPSTHVRPPSGWVNDPNGPIHWRGRYHLFFQHNPAAATHGDICWGHASSDDLAHWRIHDVALVPSPGAPDSAGCWSGCVVDDSGVATAVYTGVTDHPDDPALSATICLAYSDDDELVSWRKHSSPVAYAPHTLDLLAFRDPFVFTFEGRRYALVGAGAVSGGRPLVLLYSCQDLRDWTYLGVFLDGSTTDARGLPPADVWECPQLTRVDGEWVLIVSSWREARLERVAYAVGDIAACGDAVRFLPHSAGLVDAGHDFYAPAALREADRTLLWGWSWEEREDSEVAARGWAGVLAHPRVLGLRDGLLTTSPAPEVSALRLDGGQIRAALPAYGARVELPRAPVDLELRLPEAGAELLTLLLEGSGLACRVVVHPGEAWVRLDHRARNPERVCWPTESPLPRDWDRRLRLVLDGDLLEVHVSGGASFTERVSIPSDGRTYLSFKGPVPTHCQLTAWPLDPSAVRAQNRN